MYAELGQYQVKIDARQCFKTSESAGAAAKDLRMRRTANSRDQGPDEGGGKIEGICRGHSVRRDDKAGEIDLRKNQDAGNAHESEDDDQPAAARHRETSVISPDRCEGNFKGESTQFAGTGQEIRFQKEATGRWLRKAAEITWKRLRHPRRHGRY